MYLVRQAWANSVDPDETPQNAASHQDLHCFPLIQLFLDITLGSKLYLFKFKIKYVKQLRRLNTKGKYGRVTGKLFISKSVTIINFFVQFID